MKLYFSHPIRGKDGDKATDKTIWNNCLEASRIAHQLRLRFPTIKFYVPAEHDLFVQIAYREGRLTEKEILDTDCQIIDRCDGVLLYSPDGGVYGGCKVETAHATKTGKPVFVFTNAKEGIAKLEEYLKEIKK